MELSYVLDFYSDEAIIIPDLSKYPPINSVPALPDEPFLSILNNFLYDHPNVCENNSMTSHLPIEDRIITLDLTNMQLKTPFGYVSYITEICSALSKLIVIPVRIKSYDISHQTRDIHYHSNLIIIDNTNKTIEYFEPHGFNYLNSLDFLSIPNIFKTYFNTIDKFKSYIFTKSSDTCLFGLQQVQSFVNTSDGHCLAWSLYFIILRVLNAYILKPHISQFLNEYMVTKYTPLEIDELIKKFLFFIHTKNNNLNQIYSNYDHTSIIPYIIFDSYNKDLIFSRISYLATIYYQLLLGIKPTDSRFNIESVFNELIIYKDIYSFQDIMKKALLNIN